MATKEEAQDKVNEMLIELRLRGINFDIRPITDEDSGELYYYATSIDYPRGYISASGKTSNDLRDNLKDAIFSAFSVPANYCLSELVVFKGALAEQDLQNKAQKVRATT